MNAMEQTRSAPVSSAWFSSACRIWREQLLGLAKAEKAGQSSILLALRLLYGFGFLMAGWGKFGNLEGTGQFFASLGIPAPGFTAGLVATTELVGGLLLLLGLATRLVSLPLIATMLVALMTAHGAEIVGIKSLMAQSPFGYLVGLLLLLAFGSGAFSIDRLLKGFFSRSCDKRAS